MVARTLRALLVNRNSGTLDKKVKQYEWINYFRHNFKTEKAVENSRV